MRKDGTGGVKRTVRKYLTPDEARRVIDAAGKSGRYQERDRLLLLLLLYRHGLRVSEAVALQWHQFDLDAPRDRTLMVHRAKGSRSGAHPVRKDEAAALKKHREASEGSYVFVSERGGPMTVDAVQWVAERAGKAAGLPFKVHPHMLRHACGFYLAN
ncbi:MAG TPA: tyrosine-type recombinase/integrase, partial [Acetobacteraceae bacterium]|nr:tyrosine-type recombinase/integrase [Acetobacteraceae bacterium]